MQNLNVNITPDNYPQSLYYSQNDVGREFKINITDFTIPVGATVKIQATKPSGFGFSVAGTVSGNSVTFETTDEMTDEAGRFPAELVIESGAVVIGTANFLMVGEMNPHPEGTTDGSQGTIIPELTLLVERVEAAASSVLDMQVVAQTLPAGSQASYSYDEDLNKATFGIPEGQAGAGAAGVVASAYSAAKTYKVGDYVLYNSNLYRCTTAITTAEAWTAAHWTQIVLADDVTDLKTDLMFIKSQKIKIEQGYWAIADGSGASSNEWCRTANFLNKNIVLKADTMLMYLLAYDVDGTYVGTWNGSTFSNTYDGNKYLKEIVVSEWVKNYSNYQFKVDFRKAGANITPSAVLSDLQISDYSFDEIGFIKKSSMQADVVGEVSLDPYSFTHGSLYLGALDISVKYRVSMKEIISLPYDITIAMRNGFKLSINLFTDGVYTGYAGWVTTEYTIPANQQFRLMIARTSENTSEIANISEFVSGLYIKSKAMKIAESNNPSNFVTALTNSTRYIYHFGIDAVDTRTETPPVIPSQSIYDVRNAKNLGFEFIEANVHKTSDNKYVVTHGVNGRLGHDFDDLQGNDAGEQDVVISQKTLDYLQTNYRYRSSDPNYRVSITTLEDFLAECKRVGIKVMQMYYDVTSMQIGINIMGEHNIFMYQAPRSEYKGPITNYRKYTTKAEIIADCESFGIPYIYSMGNPNEFTDTELKDIAQTLHSMGYQLMTAYQTDAILNKLASFGWDYFILANNSFREPIIINGKQINFNLDGSVTWTAVTP